MQIIEPRPVWNQPVVQKVRGLLGDPCQTRVALVIGNGAYRHHRPLRCAVADADAMADALEDAGFEIHAYRDADRDSLGAGIEAFVRQVSGSDVALIYYSGHGMQLSGTNYMIPVDAPAEPAHDPERICSLNRLVSRVSKEAGVAIVLLDACRSDPTVPQGKDGINGTKGVSFSETGSKGAIQGRTGLAEMKAGRDVVIGFAAEPGSVALEPRKGAHSVFTDALLRQIGTRGLEIDDLFQRTSISVIRRTSEQQVPWRSLSLTKHFWFRPRSYIPAAAATFLGLLSGLLSATDRVVMHESLFHFIPMLATVNENCFCKLWSVSVLPAVYFGVAMSIINWVYADRTLLSIVLTIVSAVVAWTLAAQIPPAFFEFLEPCERCIDVVRLSLRPYNVNGFLITLRVTIAGLIGASVFFLLTNMRNRTFIRMELISLSFMFGGLATLPFSILSGQRFMLGSGTFQVALDHVNNNSFLLFAIWQPAVAMVFGYALSCQVPERALGPPLPVLKSLIDEWRERLAVATRFMK